MCERVEWVCVRSSLASLRPRRIDCHPLRLCLNVVRKVIKCNSIPGFFKWWLSHNIAQPFPTYSMHLPMPGSIATIPRSRWVATAHCANTFLYTRRSADVQHVPIDFSRGFWYDTLPYVDRITFESTKLLATSTSAVEWYKSFAHTSFLSKILIIMCQLNMNEVWTVLESFYVQLSLKTFLTGVICIIFLHTVCHFHSCSLCW